MGKRLAIVALTVAAGFALAAPAHAQTAPLDRLSNWKVGTLAFGTPPFSAPDLPDRVSDLHAKVRIGGSSVPGIEGASVRPWISVESNPDGTASGMSGVLVDVPFGSFVFTPSLGAGYGNRSALEPAAGMEFRSQLELGYEFENKSRFTLGYSRITGAGSNENRDPNNVFGLFYRVPFGGQ